MRQIKIVSDGTVGGTKLYDGYGKEIEGVTDLTVSVSVADELATATLTFSNVQVEMVATVDDETE